ncbi:Guanyl-nucleotide exchange factor [Entamoeba marina]
MSQPNTFLTKTIDELSSHVPKKQTNVVDVCNRIQKQIHTDGYSDKLMKGTEECIVPLLELVEVTFQAKNYTLCARVVDLIDKLILYKAISHTPIKYKNSEQAVDVVVTIVNILINLFHYNSLPTNLYVAKCLTTIVDVFTLSLHSTYVIASFQTIFDMYVVTPITDVNNGAYQMCVGRIVDIITTKSTPNSVTSSSALLSTLSLLCSEHWSLRESPPKLVTFSSSVTSESKLQLDQKAKNSSLELLETFLEKLPTDIHSTFCDSVFAADVALPVVAANGNDLSTFKLAVRILETLIEKYRDYLKGALGTICKVFVIPSLKQSTDRAKCILDVLQRADGNLFIELFANFDCDVSSPDVFEDIILGVVNLLKTPLADDALILLESLYQGLNRATEPWVSTLKTLLADESPAPTSELDIVALKEKKKIVAEGLEIFSNKPAKGIEYFQDKKLCGTEPLEVVQFLNSLSCIDRTALGTFLGGAGDFNQQCLTAMLTILNFEGLEIDEALRVLFRGFVMGGEGQVVERVMGAFSKEYSKSSVTIYGELEPDALFQLAMTVVCLATESHNPSVKVRAFDTFEKFQTIITTDAGFSIPVNPKLLQNTFNRVVATPFEIVQVTADNAAASLLKPQGTYSRQISAEIVREMHVAIYLPVTIESSHHAFTSTPTALNRAVTILTISIHLSAVYYLETALATSLRLLSSLARIDQPTFITQSHLPAIRALLQVSSVDGEFLSVGWSNYITSLF